MHLIFKLKQLLFSLKLIRDNRCRCNRFKEFFFKTNLDTAIENEVSQICQRKVLGCELRVIDVLTEYLKIRTDRMRYQEGQKESDTSRNI